MDFIVDVFIDSLVDTLKLVPFLFVTYLAMEALEHSTSDKTTALVARAGKTGPIVGGLLGAVPQCGFSAMAATLYAGGVITVGTLVAVILSTSDEMIPVFIAHQEAPARLLAILAIKVVVGVAVGIAVDAALRALHRAGEVKPHIHDLCERAHCHCDTDDESPVDATSEQPDTLAAVDACHCHGHDHDHGHGHWVIVRSALIHTVQVSAFILAIGFLFGLIIEAVGSDAIARVVADHPVRATIVAALVGLIPNCGASVAITELYLDGVLAFGPMLAGLLSSGGVGLLVLFRTNADLRQNLLITVFVFAVAVVVGLIVGASGILL